MVYTKPISPKKKAYLFYCFRNRKESAEDIRGRLNISKASFYRIFKNLLQAEKKIHWKLKDLLAADVNLVRDK